MITKTVKYLQDFRAIGFVVSKYVAKYCYSVVIFFQKFGMSRVKIRHGFIHHKYRSDNNWLVNFTATKLLATCS